MKKTVILLLMTMFVASGVFAQQRQRATPEERAKRQTETLAKVLELTDEQKEKVAAIDLKYVQPAESSTTDREKRREEFRKRAEQRNAEIKKELTEEQQKKFEGYLKKGGKVVK